MANCLALNYRTLVGPSFYLLDDYLLVVSQTKVGILHTPHVGVVVAVAVAVSVKGHHQAITHLGYFAKAARDDVVFFQNLGLKRVGPLAHAPYTQVL